MSQGESARMTRGLRVVPRIARNSPNWRPAQARSGTAVVMSGGVEMRVSRREMENSRSPLALSAPGQSAGYSLRRVVLLAGVRELIRARAGARTHRVGHVVLVRSFLAQGSALHWPRAKRLNTRNRRKVRIANTIFNASPGPQRRVKSPRRSRQRHPVEIPKRDYREAR